jgi:hypothetical protein
VSVTFARHGRLASRWDAFEEWVGTRNSAAALFVLALAVFALESAVLPVGAGRDMQRYVQAFLQLGYAKPILPEVVNERGPLAALGVGVPLEVGGWLAEVWLALVYASTILAWSYLALRFGARAALFTAAVLLVYPGYAILFHELASDSLFAAAFAGWALVLARAVSRPSVGTFLLTGVCMGLLVLVRPANQTLILVTLLPLLVRGRWVDRLRWVAAFYVGSAAVTQAWIELKYLRWGTAVTAKPSVAVVATAVILVPFLFPAPWRRGLLVLALVGAAGIIAVEGFDAHNPVQYGRSLVQSPSSGVFLYRAYELERIVAPDNGPASRTLAQVARRELLSKDPYRSYGVSEHEFFASGSDRIFQDIQQLGGSVDLAAVAREAIRRHPRQFATGILQTIWSELWIKRVYSIAGAPRTSASGSGAGDSSSQFVVVNGRRLPRPTEGQPIPGSRFSPTMTFEHGTAREVWGPGAKHPLVFSDSRDQRAYDKLSRDTDRLSRRIPVHAANWGLAHRLNQTSHRFPPPMFWLALGVAAVVIRRPRRILIALAPVLAGLAVVVGSALVGAPIAEYAAPISPAFVVLAVVGLVGKEPRGLPRLRRHRVSPA